MLDCIIPSCEGKTSSEIRLFRFPTNPDLYDKWMENLKIAPYKINTRSRVCSRHFEPSLTMKLRLKNGSVPTIDLGHSDENLHPPFVCYQEQIKKCAVPQCTTNSRNYKTFRLTTDEVRRPTWMEAGNTEADDKKYVFICRNHFQPYDVLARKLKDTTVPIINLDEEDEQRQPCQNCAHFSENSEYYKKKYKEIEKQLAVEKISRETTEKQLREKIEALEIELKDLRVLCIKEEFQWIDDAR